MRPISVIIAYFVGYGLQTFGNFLLTKAILQNKLRVSRTVLITVYIVMFLIRAYLYLFVPLDTTLNMACSLLLLFAVSLLYRASWLMRLLTMVFNYILSLTGDFIAAFAISSATNKSLMEINESSVLVAVGIISSCLFVFGLMYLASRMFRSDLAYGTRMSRPYLIATFLIPSTSILLFYVLSFYVMNHSLISEGMALCGGALLMGINVLVFYLYNNLLKATTSQYRALLLEQQSQAYAQELELEHHTNQDIRTLRHDLKNHALILNELLEHGDILESQKYIARYLETLHNKKQFVVSGSPQINSILNYKLEIAQAAGAQIETSVQIPGKLDVDAFDFNIIVGNLLDNAIDALRLCESKKLSIDIRYSQGLLFLSVANDYNGIVKKDKSGQYVTCKDDSATHGFGLASVQKALEKYHGTLKLKDDNCRFIATAMLYANPADYKMCEGGVQNLVQSSDL